MSRVLPFALAFLAVSGLAAAQQQDTLQHIRDLYSSAAYEDVLSAISTADDAGTPQMTQYRVFSLLALGREAEAEKAAEQVINANPRFHPDSDASPRIVDLFSKVRRRLAPDILKSMYVEAKAALDKKDRAAAVKAFEEVVGAANEADLKDDETVGEIRLLASGFLDLARALPEPKPAATEAPRSDAGTAAAPKTAVPRALPPVPIREALPAWTPPDSLSRVEFRGSIRLHIDAQGKVASAEIAEPIYVTYDPMLLKAAQSWTYQPGSINGQPVPSERVVQVVLKPR